MHNYKRCYSRGSPYHGKDINVLLKGGHGYRSGSHHDFRYHLARWRRTVAGVQHETIRRSCGWPHQLERLGVDVIEAGFPIASDGDFEAVRGIASIIRRPIIAGWPVLPSGYRARLGRL